MIPLRRHLLIPLGRYLLIALRRNLLIALRIALLRGLLIALRRNLLSVLNGCLLGVLLSLNRGGLLFARRAERTNVAFVIAAAFRTCIHILPLLMSRHRESDCLDKLLLLVYQIIRAVSTRKLQNHAGVSLERLVKSAWVVCISVVYMLDGRKKNPAVGRFSWFTRCPTAERPPPAADIRGSARRRPRWRR